MLKVVQFILINIIKMSLASSSGKNKFFQNFRSLQNFSEALAVQKMTGKRGIKLLQQQIISGNKNDSYVHICTLILF